MNILNQRNKELYSLPKISLTSIKDYELLDYVLSFIDHPFYFDLNLCLEEPLSFCNSDLDLIFTGIDNSFGFRGINNFDEINKLIKIDEHHLYVFKDFKVIKKFAIINSEALEEWYFDIVLLIKCLKTRREKYVLFELR